MTIEMKMEVAGPMMEASKGWVDRAKAGWVFVHDLGCNSFSLVVKFGPLSYRSITILVVLVLSLWKGPRARITFANPRLNTKVSAIGILIDMLTCQR